MITHFSDELDPKWARDEARDAFGAPVELAREGAVYTICAVAPGPGRMPARGADG